MNMKRHLVLLMTSALLGLIAAGPDAEARHRHLLGGAMPSLADPLSGAVITQNDPTTGCTLNPTYGYGYQISFDWSIPSRLGQKTFTLVLQHVGSAAPALLQPGLTTPSYVLIDCNTFITDTNLSNWYWQVTVVNRAGKAVGVSEQRPLSFAPCRLSGGQACNAP